MHFLRSQLYISFGLLPSCRISFAVFTHHQINLPLHFFRQRKKGRVHTTTAFLSAEEERSCAYYRGEVWITGGIAEIVKARAEQSQNDLRQFFGVRATETSSAFGIRGPEAGSGVCCMREEDLKDWVRDSQSFGKRKSNLIRSFVGSLVEQKIGSEKAEVLLHRLEKRSVELLEKGIIHPSPYATCIMAGLVKK